ncbi:putative membrane protein [Campylobacter pinnipediorum subsp. caledonicus]|uniref:Putative membrane protein n=1 Tax=Campylobacter pinnipediorum subsp. caledonicus TaxID=1874362 RepID=A0A1S6U9P2_9BACT|nr:excinuclease ABC subunit A [Campylobacter pinnipediorum]AQW88177.1 putative membrane protein [Campylobacter pinnipediorum subsp. caledonicus]
MRFLLLFLLLLSNINAVNLLTYNVYERTDRVDIMLSFDAPYEGNIFQKRDKDYTSLVLNLLNFEENINKILKSDIVQEFDFEPRQSSLILKLKSKEPILVNASKTTDGFGLRIRASLKNTPEKLANIPKASIMVGQKTKEDDGLLDSRYFLVVGVLLLLLIFLFLVKKIILTKDGKVKNTNSMPWLIKGNNAKINIIYEKYIDRLNKVVLFSYEEKKYLVLVGSTNVLLDSFGEEKIQSQEDFAVFFEENKKKLGNFLQDRQNSLNSYKDKLSQDSF